MNMHKQSSNVDDKASKVAHGGMHNSDNSFPQYSFLLLVSAFSGVGFGFLFNAPVPLTDGAIIATLPGCFIGWRARAIGTKT